MSAPRRPASGDPGSGSGTGASALKSWLRNHPDAAGPGGRGDGQAKTLAVAGVLWFCATLAIAGILAAVTTLASGETATYAADVDWGRLGVWIAVWLAVLNVPVWVLAWRRSRRSSGASGSGPRSGAREVGRERLN